MADVSVISVLIKAKDDASKVLENVQTKMGGMAAGFEKHRKSIGLGMTIVGGALTAISVSSIKAASDVEEMQGKFNTVFGELSKETEEWAKTHANAANRNRFDLMEYASTLQDTFVPMGFARDKAAEFAKSVTELSVDLGSFNNLKTADVVRDMQSALVGNTETVRKYGVVITAASVETEIMNQGWASSKGEITEAMKVQARMNMIIAGTSDAQGDAIRTSGSFANQMLGMQASMKEAQVTLGQALLPAITALVSAITPVIISMANWMKENEGLAKILILVAASLGAVMLVLGPMLLILPQLVAGMKLFAVGIRIVNAAMAANPIGALVVVLTTLALVTLPLVMKHWDKIWATLKKVTEMTVNFVIGMLNKLTLLWRKQVEFILDMVAKLVGLGSKLPFVGDKFKDAANAIEAFSDKIKEGIPEIDITTDKHQDLQNAVDSTATTVEDSAVRYGGAMGDMIVAGESFASETSASLNRVSEAYEKHVEERISTADMVKQIQLQTTRNQFEEEQKRLQIVKDNFAKEVEATDARHQRVNDSWAKFRSDNNPILLKLQEAQMDFGDVMEELAIRHGVSLEEMARQLGRAQVEHGDLSALLASRFGSDVDDVLIDAKRMADGVIAEQARMARERARIQDASLSDLERMIKESNQRIKDENEKARLMGHGLSQVQGALASGAHIGAGVMDAIRTSAATASAASVRTAPSTRMTAGGQTFTQHVSTAALKAAGYLANGGIVTQPSLAVIGEAGPEAVVPLSRAGGMGTTNNFHFHGAVYGVEDLKEAVVEAVRDHAISGGFSGVFAEA